MMPAVVTSLMSSEKAVLAIVLMIGATVLTAIGKMEVDAWKEFATYIYGIYVGGKAIQGAADSMAKRPPAAAPTAVAVANEPATVVPVAPSVP